MRKHSPKNILGQFGEIEGGSGGHFETQRFRRSGNWLISESYLNDLIFGFFFFRKVPRPPGFRLVQSWRGIWTILYRRIFAKRIKGASVADAIYVKSNARAFYMKSPRKTIKLGLESSSRLLTSLRNEVEVREKLREIGRVSVPQLLSSFSKSPPCFLSEELILGRRCNSLDELSVFVGLVESLTELHQVYGVSWQKVSEVMARDTLVRIEKTLSELTWEEDWEPRSSLLTFATEFLQSGEYVPCSLTHGDLSPGNMLIDEDRKVYLADWELAGERPIIFDFGKLLNTIPKLDETFRSIFEEHASSCEALEPMSYERQLILMNL